MVLPSGLHAIVFAKEFARNVIGRRLAPSAVATLTFVNPFVPVDRSATQRLSGDQTKGGVPTNGGRSKTPFASRRSCLLVISRARISESPRTEPSDVPSGENRGEWSTSLPLVRRVSDVVTKSYI